MRRKKEKNGLLMRKIGRNEEKQPSISDCIGNTNALLENRYF